MVESSDNKIAGRRWDARGCLRACGRVRRGSVRVPPGLGGGDEGLVPLGDL